MAAEDELVVVLTVAVQDSIECLGRGALSLLKQEESGWTPVDYPDGCWALPTVDAYQQHLFFSAVRCDGGSALWVSSSDGPWEQLDTSSISEVSAVSATADSIAIAGPPIGDESGTEVTVTTAGHTSVHDKFGIFDIAYSDSTLFGAGLTIEALVNGRWTRLAEPAAVDATLLDVEPVPGGGVAAGQVRIRGVTGGPVVVWEGDDMQWQQAFELPGPAVLQTLDLDTGPLGMVLLVASDSESSIWTRSF